MVPFAQYEQASGVIMAAGFKNERPATKPLFSHSGTSYYPAWRAAIRCWVKDPERRPSMDDVAQMLLPRVPSDLQRDESDQCPCSILTPPPTTQRPWKEPEGGHFSDSEAEETQCYCKAPSFGEMVSCDNDECETEWVSPGRSSSIKRNTH